MHGEVEQLFEDGENDGGGLSSVSVGNPVFVNV